MPGRFMALLRGDNVNLRGQKIDPDKGQGYGATRQPDTPTNGIGYAPPQIDWGPIAWRPAGHGQAPWEQIGAYGEPRLSQYPARWEGAQLENGRMGNMPGWMVPYRSTVPYWQVTVAKVNVPGAQRVSGKPGNVGAAGPLAARAMRESVLQAQVQQSGLAAMSWAQALKTWGTGS